MTPKQLANHLLMLDEDDRAYYRHFWWKGSYEVITGTIIPFFPRYNNFSFCFFLCIRYIRIIVKFLLNHCAICVRSCTFRSLAKSTGNI